MSHRNNTLISLLWITALTAALSTPASANGQENPITGSGSIDNVTNPTHDDFKRLGDEACALAKEDAKIKILRIAGITTTSRPSNIIVNLIQVTTYDPEQSEKKIYQITCTLDVAYKFDW